MALADFPPLGGLYAYEPPASLWALVESYVPGSESQEVKIMLGESLVQQSLELHQEVQLLLEIWRDYRQETENQLIPQRLPEPPAVRERLTAEIQFFVNCIKEKSGNRGGALQILSSHNSEVLDYAMQNKRPGSALGSRPSTAQSSRDGSETPMMHHTPDRPASKVSTASIELEVENMNDKLNLGNFGEVVQHLRETLNEEVLFLLGDIEFLQKCLESEADFRSQSFNSPDPSIADLREERSKLEKDFLSSSPSLRPAKPRDIRPLDVQRPLSKKSMSSGIKLCSATTSKPLPLGDGKPTPLKATHSLKSQVLALDSNYFSQSKKISLMDNGAGGTRTKIKSTMSKDKLNSNSAGSGDKQCGSRSRARDPSSCSPDAPAHVLVHTTDATLKNIEAAGFSGLSHSGSLHTPSPPSSAKPAAATSRPTSAQRFRKMVQQCRD